MLFPDRTSTFLYKLSSRMGWKAAQSGLGHKGGKVWLGPASSRECICISIFVCLRIHGVFNLMFKVVSGGQTGVRPLRTWNIMTSRGAAPHGFLWSQPALATTGSLDFDTARPESPGLRSSDEALQLRIWAGIPSAKTLTLRAQNEKDPVPPKLQALKNRRLLT